MTQKQAIQLFERRKVRTVWSDETVTTCNRLKQLPNEKK